MSKIFQPALRPCVGIMILNRVNQIFVGARIDNSAEYWQMPQGGIDDGESPFEAAKREMREETGIKNSAVELLYESKHWYSYLLPAELQGKIWQGRWQGQTMRWFAFRLVADDKMINIQTEHPEFRAWQWVAIDKLVSLAVPFKQEIYHQVVDEFRFLWHSHG